MRELFEIARSGTRWEELTEALSQALAPVVPHDAVAMAGTTPAAGHGVSSFSFWHGFEADFAQRFLWHYYAEEVPGTPAELARRTIPACVIAAGDGAGPRGRLAGELLSAHGVGSLLHMLLRDGRGAWGQLALMRSQGGRPFDAADVRQVARQAPVLIAVMCEKVTTGPLSAAKPAPPPGVIIVGADNAIRAVTPQAHAWSGELRGHAAIPEWASRSFLMGLAMQARRHARDPGECPPLAVGPAATFGRWIACHGQPLDDGSGDVVLVVQSATTEQLLPSFCDWYGITARERQIITCLCDAATSKQIARRLDLSVHTVNDHFKAIYRKTGAHGRDELLGVLTPR